MIEYGISEGRNGWVTRTRNLSDALKQVREMEDPDQWRIVERSVSEWTEVE